MFSFVNGGRSTLFMIAGLAVITWLLVVPAVSRRQLLAFIRSACSVVFFITMYPVRSVEAVGAEVDFLAHASAYTELVPINVDTLSTMRDVPGTWPILALLCFERRSVRGSWCLRVLLLLVQSQKPQ